MEATTNLGSIVKLYKPIIAKFKNRADVQSGHALGYREGQSPTGKLLPENTPKSIGPGLSTTGWCVSASQALLLDKVFTYFIGTRGAMAKLVSIDIKEQYYGYCYNGSQNKWHTAILVYDSGLYFIIDITCAQFGNAFVGKDVWEYRTWESTFRNMSDTHKITGFSGEDLNFVPVFTGQTTKITKEMESVSLVQSLKNITTITDDDREFLSDFFINKINIINHKLETGNINSFDYKYIDRLNSLLRNFDYSKVSKAYNVQEFQNKEVFKKWLLDFMGSDKITKTYTLFSPTLAEACQLIGIDVEDINVTTNRDTARVYLVTELTNASSFLVNGILGVNMIVPFGIKLAFDNDQIYNSGDIRQIAPGKIATQTNTIVIDATI